MVIGNGCGQVLLVGGGVAVPGGFDLESLALGRGKEGFDALFGHDSRATNTTRCCEGVDCFSSGGVPLRGASTAPLLNLVSKAATSVMGNFVMLLYKPVLWRCWTGALASR